MSRLIVESKTNSAVIPFEKMGPPGIVTHLHLVPMYIDESKNKEREMRGKISRKFDVTAKFCKGLEYESEINFDFPIDSGDSLYSFAPKVSELKINSNTGEFSLYPNSEKRFSTINFVCEACSVEEARSKFHITVGPALDHLAYICKTPLHVTQITIKDSLNITTHTDVLTPYPVVVLQGTLGVLYESLIPVYAMYREAINASSPFYKFFCFYKILEGLLKNCLDSFIKRPNKKAWSFLV